MYQTNQQRIRYVVEFKTSSDIDTANDYNNILHTQPSQEQDNSDYEEEEEEETNKDGG